MKWFFPSWNGDVRVEAVDAERSKLIIVKATLGEQKILADLGQRLVKKGWADSRVLWKVDGPETQEVPLTAPLKKIGPLLVKMLKPGRETLTAVKLVGGKIETVTGSDSRVESIAEIAGKPEAEAAATVKRATPCCPQCVEGAIAPATEVLLSFLTPEQHEQWASERYIIVRGGLSHHRYLLAHRHTKRAQRMGRICYDIDDGGVVHFHDQSVPPEEEVLAAKLVLEHAEPWLRNPSTLLINPRARWTDQFDNPFGRGGWDGMPDAGLTQGFGAALLATRAFSKTT